MRCSMTMCYCRTCGRDVHITHKEEDCDGDPDLSTPDCLKPEPREIRDDTNRKPPNVF